MGEKKLEQLTVTEIQEVDLELKAKFNELKSKKTKIEDFFNEFLGEFLSEQTKKAYAHDIKSFFEFMIRGGEQVHHPRDILDGHFQLYRNSLIAKDYTSATVNRKLVAIRSFMKWAVAKKLIEYNPLDAIKLPKVQTATPTQAFDDNEVIDMLSRPDKTTKMGHTHYISMLMLFSLGLRRSELCQIKIQDFLRDRGHNILKIHGKGDKVRVLPLSNHLAAAIKDYVDFLLTQDIQLETEDYLLQTKKDGKNTVPVNGSTIYRMIEKYAKECAINKKLGPHSCRATAISHLLDTQNTPIRDVAIFAGHANITTTERYDKRRKNLEKSAAYQINYGDTEN